MNTPYLWRRQGVTKNLKKDNEMNKETKSFAFSLTTEDWKFIRKASIDKEISTKALVIRAIKEYVAREKYRNE